jgi:hypothetical protein
MTSVAATCRECQRPRKPNELFCECGAFLEYSAAAGEQPTNGGQDETAVGETGGGEFERPPGRYEPTSEPVATSGVSMRVVHCPNEECKALNPATLVLCWKCKMPTEGGVEAKPPWNLRSFLHLEEQPLHASERSRPAKPFLSKDPRTLLRTGLIVAGVLLLASTLVIGAITAWGPASAGATHGYGIAREALFPRYNPVIPSSVNPPREKTRVTKRGTKRVTKRVKILHPPADAFDRNLSTYWQSKTPRQVPDKISVTFNPAAHHIEEVVVFAGDPTGTTIVPASLQMTFYRWDPDPSQQSKCEQHTRAVFPVWLRRGAHCVIAVEGPFELKNTPTPQRFSTGKHANVALVVITIRGVHSTDNPKLRAAITDIEFFDRD